MGDHFFKSELVSEVELGGIRQIIKKTFVELNERVANLFSEGMIENTVEENLEYFDQEVQQIIEQLEGFYLTDWQNALARIIKIQMKGLERV